MDLPNIVLDWLAASIRLSAPPHAGWGRRSLHRADGIVSIGIEGMMLCGTMAAVAASLATGNLPIAALFAMLVGGLMALVHADLTVTPRRRSDRRRRRDQPVRPGDHEPAQYAAVSRL